MADASAVLAILLAEDDWEALSARFQNAPYRYMSPINVLESRMIMLTRLGKQAWTP